MAITVQSTMRPIRRMGSGAGATGLSNAAMIAYLTALRTFSASFRNASTSAPYFSRALA
jgi:hypothetical protein